MDGGRSALRFVAGMAFLLGACSGPGALPPDDAGGADGTSTPASCDQPVALSDLRATVENGSESCRAWLDLVRGRVVLNSVGSAVIWTRQIPSQLGLVVSAVHVLGSGWFTSPTGADVPASLVTPGPEDDGVDRLMVPPADGSFDQSEVSGLWVTFNPAIPAAQNADVRTILPRSDFFVGLTDNRRVVDNGLTLPPTAPLDASVPLELYDPGGLSRDDQRVGDLQPGALVLLAGYPQAGPTFGAFSVGRVLDDTQAGAAVEELAAAGDEEGSIPYDPQVEVFIEGEAAEGMSGGGAFHRDGRLVGILVRAGKSRTRSLVRAVRLSHLLDELATAAGALSAADRTRADPFLPPLE
jgi:hypothetical protein